MNHTHQTTGILVIANRTCPCPTLVDEVARRASDPPSRTGFDGDCDLPRV
jgi:hypothetical protein